MSVPRNIPDYPAEILSLSMFHPDICCRAQAENYVLQHRQGDGSYIVRPNTDNDPSFVSITISIPGNETCNARVIIQKNKKGFTYYITDKLKFSTFNELLNYYREHRIHCKQGIDNLRLERPLRKLNQYQTDHGSGGGKDPMKPSSSFDDDQRGLKQPSQGNKAGMRDKVRTMSEPQLPFIKPKFGGSLKSTTQKHWNSGLTRTHSEDTSSSHGLSNILDYANSGSIQQDPRSMINCRPPAPLPRPKTQPLDDSIYYSSIQVGKDFFLETYRYLKDNDDHCECGLQLNDSELALGWTIHRSHDPATLNHIFFQQDKTTTWDMPVDLVYELTEKQMRFIIILCHEGKQPIPDHLRERLDKEMGRRANVKSKTHF